MEVGHLDGGDGGFRAFVAEAAAGSLLRFLEAVDRENAEDDWHSAACVDVGDALRHSLAYVAEVGRVAAYNAADDDDRVGAERVDGCCCGVDEFDCAGHLQAGYVLVGDTGGVERVDCAVGERDGYRRVPPGGDDDGSEVASACRFGYLEGRALGVEYG